MIARVIMAIALMSTPAQAETGRATRFAYPGDKWTGGDMRCLGRPLRHGEHGIAHRTLPCGTVVRVTNLRTKRHTVAVVVDAGPWGAMSAGAWVIKRHRREPGTWRGIADLSPAVVADLRHRSFDRVRLEVL